MTALFCQRWRDTRGVYRVPDEVIRTADYDVGAIDLLTAKRFITQHHYSRSYPACRFRFGLFTRGQLVGVAVFSMPMSAKVLTNVFPGDVMDSVELGRFVLLDTVPGNGETWFLARCRALLKREAIRGVVAFSDDTARRSPTGETTFTGHIGTIYQASNAVYLGRGKARTLRLLPDNTVLVDRVISKIRNREQGWSYSVQTLVRHGAAEPQSDTQPYLAEWLEGWLPRITRPLRHPGNHRYAWSLSRSLSLLSCSQTYPKKENHSCTR